MMKASQNARLITNDEFCEQFSSYLHHLLYFLRKALHSRICMGDMAWIMTCTEESHLASATMG